MGNPHGQLRPWALVKKRCRQVLRLPLRDLLGTLLGGRKRLNILEVLHCGMTCVLLEPIA
jgi:hypothetical protein